MPVPRLELTVTVTDTATGRDEPPVPLSSDGHHHRVELSPLPPGDYRLTVAGAGSSGRLVQPVSEIVMVAGEESQEDL